MQSSWYHTTARTWYQSHCTTVTNSLPAFSLAIVFSKTCKLDQRLVEMLRERGEGIGEQYCNSLSLTKIKMCHGIIKLRHPTERK